MFANVINFISSRIKSIWQLGLSKNNLILKHVQNWEVGIDLIQPQISCSINLKQFYYLSSHLQMLS